MKALNFFAVLFSLFILSSCGDDGAPDQDVAPSITIIKPVKDVKAGEKIPIELEFADDKGLQHVEVSLGSNVSAGAPFFYTQRGISGIKDNLSIMVDPPAGVDILGSNYILITCRDRGGNVTVADENFNVVDANVPTANFIYNDTVASADTASRIEVVYKAEDTEGLDKVVLEMWNIDAQGNKIKLFDSITHDAGGSTSFTKQHFFKGKTTYKTGDLFTFLIRVYDESGNVIEVNSNSTGQVF